MDGKLSEIKPLIRGILLALGRRTTEREFRKEYFENEAESFNLVLRDLNMGFLDFLRAMPDVCRAYRSGEEVIIERVSTEETSHMDNLTIARRKKRNPLKHPNLQFRPNFSHFIRRPYHNSVQTNHLYRPPIIHTKADFTPYSWPHSQFGKVKPLGTSHQNNVTPYFSRPQPADINSIAKRIEKFHAAPNHTMKRNGVKYGTDQNNKENSKPSNISKHSSVVNYNRVDVSSLPPPPHLLMPTIVIKGCSSNDKNLNKDNVVPTTSDISNAANFDSTEKKDDEIYKISSDSSNWSDENEPPKRIIESRKFMLSSTNPFKFERCSTYKTEARNIKDEGETSTSMDTSAKLKNSLAEHCLRKTEAMFGKLKTDAEKKKNYITKSMTIPPPRIIPFTGVQSRMYFDVQIQIFHSPSQFVFQYHKQELDSLMNEINIHYNNLKDSYAFMISDITPGLTVAGFDNGKWYRAEVLYLTGSDILVLLVDYSIRKYLKPQNLRYLEKSFATPSRKSLKGSLFGVKSSTSDKLWNVDSIMGFLARTENEKLSATLKNFKNGIYELSLIDENCQRIKDFMIEKGFAVDDENADRKLNAFLY